MKLEKNDNLYEKGKKHGSMKDEEKNKANL